jgi:hypothetical protein
MRQADHQSSLKKLKAAPTAAYTTREGEIPDWGAHFVPTAALIKVTQRRTMEEYLAQQSDRTTSESFESKYIRLAAFDGRA